MDPATGQSYTDIEQCPLIEKPGETRLIHNLNDCPGFSADPPLRSPNADSEDPATIVKIINKGKTIAFGSTIGRIVAPGNIGIYLDSRGKVKAVSHGRWNLAGLRCSWVNTKVNLNVDQFSYKTLLIVRVPANSIGLIDNNGNEELIGPGTHVFNNGRVTFKQFKKQSETVIAHGPFHIIRVPRGKYAKIWVIDANNTIVPRLLSEGTHCIENIHLKYELQIDVLQDYIQHGALNVLQVPKGEVAKVFHDNKPRLLGEGVHFVESLNFKYCGRDKLTAKRIVHGTITIVRVPLGEIGVAWDTNEPHFIDKAGLYSFNSPDFLFVKHVSANDRVISLGSKKVIMVYTGEVGVSFNKGELHILNHGRHVIDAATHLFEGFMSTQQRSIRLVTETHGQRASKKEKKKKKQQGDAGGYDTEAGVEKAEEEKQSDLQLSSASNLGNDDDNSDLMACETKDLVKVGVRADVFYSIADPKKAIERMQADEIEDLVRETAIATLTNIIRSTALNEIAQSKLPSAVSSTVEAAHEKAVQGLALPSAPLFFDKAHDEFLSKLHDDFIERYGLDIANIRIESFKIMDEELASSISKHALVTAQTENELANLQGKTAIATAEKRRDAEVTQIAAEAEARALKTQEDAKNMRLIEEAKAEAEAERLRIQMRAQAEADAAIIKAKAESESIRLVAEAEGIRAELLSRTKFGTQAALLTTYSDMVKSSNANVEKIIYCDPTLQQNGGSPFALPALQNLQRDLHTLSALDIQAQQNDAEKKK